MTWHTSCRLPEGVDSARIVAGDVVTLDYMVKADSGALIDHSDDEPLEVLVGEGQLVEGLEKALLGRRKGDHLEVRVAPDKGYGEHQPDRVIVAQRRDLPRHFEPEVGLELTYPGDNGEPLSMWVTDVQGEQVTLDGNHPLAGKNLHFTVTILSVRPASAQERAAGQAGFPTELDDDFETGHTTH